MANNIALFKKYIDMLDEVYQNAAVTAALESDSTLASQGANTNEIVIPKLAMDGLGNYSRNDGYVKGSVTLNHETVKFNYDRGRKFNVDAMDNEETAGLAFGRLAGEFVRTKVVPELDAWRLSTYAGKASGSSKATGSLADGEAVIKALITAQNVLDEAEVTAEGRVLFITPTLHNAIAALDSYKSREVLSSFGSVVKVPQSRFYTAVDLNDGKTGGQEAGGFKKGAQGKDINFLVVERSAVMQYTKHSVSKVITPEANQENDGWLFFFRSYGLADVYENKTAGLYLHHKA